MTDEQRRESHALPSLPEEVRTAVYWLNVHGHTLIADQLALWVDNKMLAYEGAAGVAKGTLGAMEAWQKRVAELEAALKASGSESTRRYRRAPEYDRRIRDGDDYAGDAFVSWCAVGHQPADAFEIEPPEAPPGYRAGRRKLIYNKDTKQIDVVVAESGFVVESFDPPFERKSGE